LPFPRRAMLGVAKLWGRTNLWLLRAICGVEVDWHGLDKIPRGPLIVAAKHQSIWETFALLPLFADPTFIVKRELMWIPVFGWCMWRAAMISVDRGAGSQALFAMLDRANSRSAAVGRSSSSPKAPVGRPARRRPTSSGWPSSMRQRA